VIEPVLKPQWWVSCSGMAAQACEAVRDGRLEVVPREFETTWFRRARSLPAALAALHLEGGTVRAWAVRLAARAAALPAALWNA
jgi:hypothetical protein